MHLIRLILLVALGIWFIRAIATDFVRAIVALVVPRNRQSRRDLMQDREPQAPPVPPAPPAPSDQTQPQAGAGQQTEQQPADDPNTRRDESLPQSEEIGDAPIVPEGDAPITPVPPAAEVALPSIPDINEIPEAVKRACLADGIPEAEFAKDFRLPVEAREKLILDSAKELTGVRPEMTKAVSHAAEKITTVGELIAFFEESHPDHPTYSGAGS